MRSFIAYDRNKIYTSLLNPDFNPDDTKLTLLIKLTHELGKFGYIIDQEVLGYLSEADIHEYFRDIVPVLYDLYYHREYTEKSDAPELNDWKSRRTEPWISGFYTSGDFRFVLESGEKVGRKVTYLDRMSEADLFNTYREMAELKDFDLSTFMYLSEYYKDDHTVMPKNETAILCMSLWRDDLKPTKWSDYKNLHLGRKHRRILLAKLEALDLQKEPRGEIKALLSFLHPAEYKKLFPKVYEYWKNLKETNNISQTAKELLDSGNVEEFKKRFISFLYSKKYDETDLLTLLYSNKLKVSDLLWIYNKLREYEVGVPRYYGNVCLYNSGSIVSIIPTFKEFILARIGKGLKDIELSGRKIYLDPDLLEYNVGSGEKRIEPIIIGKLKDVDKVTIKTIWPKETCRFDELVMYAWKGRGKIFKKIGFENYNEEKTESWISTTINLKDLRDKGFKYLVFDSRVYKCNRNKNCNVQFKFGSDLNVNLKMNIRNNFGGLIDLQTLEITTLQFDLTTIPTLNGNIQEAIVKYILPEFRFTAYDLLGSIVGASGGEIVQTDPDIILDSEYYKNLNI